MISLHEDKYLVETHPNTTLHMTWDSSYNARGGK